MAAGDVSARMALPLSALPLVVIGNPTAGAPVGSGSGAPAAARAARAAAPRPGRARGGSPGRAV
jgi:hypothetical protein